MVTKDKEWWTFEVLRLSTNYNGYNPLYAPLHAPYMRPCVHPYAYPCAHPYMHPYTCPALPKNFILPFMIG